MQGQTPDNNYPHHPVLTPYARLPQPGMVPGQPQAGQPGDRGQLTTPNQRHIKTEQKRRDRINEGFTALQNLLPMRDKVEKAAMLTQAADYIRTLQGLTQQVVDSSLLACLPPDQQFSLRSLLPRRPEQPAPYAPYTAPPGPMLAHGIPQGHSMPPPYRAHEHASPPEHSIVNQMQLLHCAQAMAQPGYYTALHLGGQSQGMAAQQAYQQQQQQQQQQSTARPALPDNSSSPARSPSPPPTLVAPKASMPSQSGLQQLVEAAGGIAAENKENASRKRGRDFVEMIAPAPKQARCYDVGAAIDFASLPDFMIHI